MKFQHFFLVLLIECTFFERICLKSNILLLEYTVLKKIGFQVTKKL